MKLRLLRRCAPRNDPAPNKGYLGRGRQGMMVTEPSPAYWNGFFKETGQAHRPAPTSLEAATLLGTPYGAIKFDVTE